jgi:hypothetical protein
MLKNVKNAEFNRCSFKQCIFCHSESQDDWKERGGVFCADLNTSLQLNACKFEDCGIVGAHSYYSSSVIALADVSAVDCAFIRCYGSHSNDRANFDRRDPKNRLFCKVSMNKNNKMEDCKNALFV